MADNGERTGSAERSQQKRGFFAKPLIKILLVIIIGIGLILSLSDARKLLDVAQRIQPFYLVLALIATILSYLFLGLALKRLLELVGERLSFKETFAISWVATSLNYLVSTGGVGGLTMRIFLLRRKNISFSETFLVSFIQALLLNGVLIGFVLFGFAYLLMNRGLHFYQYLTSAAVLVITLTLSLLATGSVIDRAFRERFIDFFYRWINRISFRLTRRTVVTEVDLNEFKVDFHQGISLMLTQKSRIVIPTFYVFLDWVCCLLTLYFSFITIGYRISPGVLVVGFAVGIFVSLISVIPGAIGIMEGSMAAIYYSLDVPFEVAMIAVIVYRFALHVFPFVTSILFYGPLLKEAKALKVNQVPHGGLASLKVSASKPGESGQSKPE
jgi:uncharacterized protein (TIRG00374 family)